MNERTFPMTLFAFWVALLDIVENDLTL